MVRYRSLFSTLFTLTILVNAASLQALIEPQDSLIRAKEFRHAGLWFRDVFAEAKPDGLLEVPGTVLSLDTIDGSHFLDSYTGHWETLKPNHPLLPGQGVGNKLTWQDFGEQSEPADARLKELAWHTFVAYLETHHSELDLEIAQPAQPGHVIFHNNADFLQVYVPRIIHGIPVVGSFLTAVIDQGNLVLLKAFNWGKVFPLPKPLLTYEAATVVVQGHLDPLVAKGTWGKPSLAFVPMFTEHAVDADSGEGISFRLVWILRPTFEDSPKGWQAYVDAHTGELLLFREDVDLEPLQYGRVVPNDHDDDCNTDGLTIDDDRKNSNDGTTHKSTCGQAQNRDTCYGPPSSCALALSRKRPRVKISQDGPPQFRSGDGDSCIDNGEQVELSIMFENAEVSQLESVIAVTALNNPDITETISFANGNILKLETVGTQTKTMIFTASGLDFNNPLEFEVCANLDGSAPCDAGAQEIGFFNVECDIRFHESKTFSFEEGDSDDPLEGWEVIHGSFSLNNESGANGSNFSIRSSSSLESQCDQIRSPLLILTPASTLSLETNFEIESYCLGCHPPSWHDRANLSIYHPATDTRSEIAPNGGQEYSAFGPFGTCVTRGQEGWAGSSTNWLGSTWTAEALGSADWVGEFIRLDFAYGTNESAPTPDTPNQGFWFDEVTLTHVGVLVEEGQCDDCPFFADGFESGDTAAWSLTHGLQ